ncbi:hypothetical protein [Brucella rhizosphaerae]|nr:hypothetical protein [Brucella rhizosphaerae]
MRRLSVCPVAIAKGEQPLMILMDWRNASALLFFRQSSTFAQAAFKNDSLDGSRAGTLDRDGARNLTSADAALTDCGNARGNRPVASVITAETHLAQRHYYSDSRSCSIITF